jgi:hypothetical protein
MDATIDDNVDFYIEIDEKYIGLQIKPITYEQTPEIYRWKEWLSKTHDKFEKGKGGKVFIVFSIKKWASGDSPLVSLRCFVPSLKFPFGELQIRSERYVTFCLACVELINK